MKVIYFIDRFLARIENAVLILLLTAMIFLAFLQVILRNFFSTAIFWGDTFLRHLVLWVGFLGAALATREGKHINIDVLSKILSPTIKKVTNIIINLFSSAICFFLMLAAITFIKDEKAAGTTLFADLPTWIFQLIIAIGFGLMVFRFLIRATESSFTLLKKGEN